MNKNNSNTNNNGQIPQRILVISHDFHPSRSVHVDARTRKEKRKRVNICPLLLTKVYLREPNSFLELRSSQSGHSCTSATLTNFSLQSERQAADLPR